MTTRAQSINFLGTVETASAGSERVKRPGDTVLVERGTPRLLQMKCPCGCGDTLTINLDKRSGPAWRIYWRRGKLTLFPSYWRDTKCGSHFIVWNSQIYWCDWEDENDELWKRTSDIEDKVVAVLPTAFTSYEVIADQLGELPWDVLRACQNLVRKQIAVSNGPWHKGEFKRVRS
jgi:hypothetical protein